jgi:hypothetical protein
MKLIEVSKSYCSVGDFVHAKVFDTPEVNLYATVKG